MSPLRERAATVGWRRAVFDQFVAPSVLWRLVRPQNNVDFLVEDEHPWWENRYHSAILLQPAFDLMAALTLTVWIQLDIGLTRTAVATAFVIFSISVMSSLILQLHRSDRYSAVIFGALILIAYALRRDRDLLAFLVVVGFGYRFGLRWVKWRWYRRIVVTDRRVIEVAGLLGNTVATMPLFRITDAEIKTTPLGELLGYSQFRIESAGQDQALGNIRFLDDGERFHQLLIELATTPKPIEPKHAMPQFRNGVSTRMPLVTTQSNAAEIDRMVN